MKVRLRIDTGFARAQHQDEIEIDDSELEGIQRKKKRNTSIRSMSNRFYMNTWKHGTKKSRIRKPIKRKGDTNMNNNEIKENKVTLVGTITEEFQFDHELYGEEFYMTKVTVERESGTSDIIPIMVSERLVDVKENWTGQFVRIAGQFRSYNKHEENRNKLVLSVFAREFEVWEDDGTIRPIEENSIFLDGCICKEPTYRKTPLGREITDVLLAVNRPYGKSDYIPCILWGRNARYASNFGVGDRIQVRGRIQSREYFKKISEDEFETRVAYEVSVQKFKEVDYEQDED